MSDGTVTESSMTGTCRMLKDFEERLSKCAVDKNEIAAVHLLMKDCFTNISDGNVPTEADLGQWEILKAEETNGVTFEDDPLYLCNDTAVIEMEIKLVKEERDENLEVCDEIEWTLNEELKELKTFLSQLEQNELDSKGLYEKALEKYVENLENAFITNFKVIDELKNVPGRIILDQYLCESPLLALKEKIDCFLETFNFHLRNHFMEAAKTNGAERCRNVIVEQRILEARLSATLYKNGVLECLLKGQEAAVSHTMTMADAIGNGVKTLLTTNIKKELATLKNIKIAEDLISDFKTDLISLSQMSANVKQLKHILTMCNSKYNRVNYWLLQTEKWADCIKLEKKLINAVLHVLHSEKEEPNKVLCFLKDFETYLKREHDSVMCRTAFMHTQLQNPMEDDMLHSVLVNILGQISVDKGISTKLSWRQLKEAVINIKKATVWKQNNFFQSFKKTRHILFENDNLFKLINGLKRESGLNYSQMNINAHQQRLSDSENALCAINEDFIKKQNTLSKNYFMKHRRLLWVYILCNQEKLAEVLSHVNEHLPDV
ncbi:uncharacterized protein LOC124605437 isoform X1 [Schistocerca americana]|uniref:uncharacterized protein LOC124605437 isoform X1 n=2 Tax=Schistocerca americana TaxID=7009 RepID=UPI001F4F96AB|nr:uncharacterized protein LOC124605437 isoform X1 [Schistocerca americana]XP_049956411.1 uncharacterized protein LOC126473422 isoform X1 [Schistocerca serialis cubense]